MCLKYETRGYVSYERVAPRFVAKLLQAFARRLSVTVLRQDLLKFPWVGFHAARPGGGGAESASGEQCHGYQCVGAVGSIGAWSTPADGCSCPRTSGPD